MSEIRTYTAREVADILHITTRSLYDYIKAGKIHGVKRGKYWLFTPEAINAYLTPDK